MFSCHDIYLFLMFRALRSGSSIPPLAFRLLFHSIGTVSANLLFLEKFTSILMILLLLTVYRVLRGSHADT